jgi:tetratricopeptide (TPR) repeat protein
VTLRYSLVRTHILLFFLILLSRFPVAQNSINVNITSVHLVTEVTSHAYNPSLDLLLKQSQLNFPEEAFQNLPTHFKEAALVWSGDHERLLTELATEKYDCSNFVDYWQSVALLRLGQHQEALSCLASVGAVLPLEILIEHAIEHREFTDAIVAIEALSTVRNSSVGHYWREVGELYRGKGRFAEAESIFYLGVEHAPDYLWNYVALGDLYSSNKDYEQAAKAYYSAWELGIDASVARRLGVVNREQGKLVEAKEFLQQAVDLDPAEKHARYHLAQILNSLGETEQAVQLLEEAINTDQDFWLAQLELALLYAQNPKSSDKGEACYCAAILAVTNVDPQSLQTVLNRGEHLWSTLGCEEIDASCP